MLYYYVKKRVKGIKSLHKIDRFIVILSITTNRKMSSSVSPDLRLDHIESYVATMQLDEKTNKMSSSVAPDLRLDHIEVYSEEDELLAKQWGMSVPEMLEVLETINLHDPNEGQHEYSPEWPIDFIGDGFYANDLKWVREKLTRMRDDVPLHQNPYTNDSVCVSIDMGDAEYEVK